MRIRAVYFWLALFLAAQIALAQGTPIPLGSLKIPPARLIDWTKSGVLDGTGIPSTAGWTVTDLTCNNSTDATTITNAIAAAAPNTVLRLPVGTCTIPNGIQVVLNKSNLVLRGRGSGAGGTTLQMGQGNQGRCTSITKNAICMGSEAALGGTVNLTAAPVRGNTVVTATGATGLVTGDWAIISEISADQETDQTRYDFSLNPNFPNVKKQQVRVTNVSGNTITFTPPIRVNYEAGRSPFIREVPVLEKIGIEDVKMVHLQPNTDFTVCVVMQQAVNSWVTNVRWEHCPGGAISLSQVAHAEVSHNFLLDIGVIGTSLCPSSNNAQCGFGMWQARSVHDTRFSDNIVDPTGSSPRYFTFDQGGSSTGNVISYNW
jgi:hypothetical protein